MAWLDLILMVWPLHYPSNYCEDSSCVQVSDDLERRHQSCKNTDWSRTDEWRHVLLHELAKGTSDPVELRSKSIHIFLTGHDLNTTTIGNAIFHPLWHPGVWATSRGEKFAINAPFIFKTLKDMRYLQYIIRECKIPIKFFSRKREGDQPPLKRSSYLLYHHR